MNYKIFKKSLILIVIMILFILSFSPIVNSYSIEKNEDLQLKDDGIESLECIPLNFGLIHGDTMWAKGWTCGILRFTKIVAKTSF